VWLIGVLVYLHAAPQIQLLNSPDTDDDDDDDERRINLSVALSPKTTRTRNNKMTA